MEARKNARAEYERRGGAVAADSLIDDSSPEFQLALKQAVAKCPIYCYLSEWTKSLAACVHMLQVCLLCQAFPPCWRSEDGLNSMTTS